MGKNVKNGKKTLQKTMMKTVIKGYIFEVDVEYPK